MDSSQSTFHLIAWGTTVVIFQRDAVIVIKLLVTMVLCIDEKQPNPGA